MRIFQTITFNSTSSLNENRTWYNNLYEPLIDMGHDVFLLPADEGRYAMLQNNSYLRDLFSDKLITIFKREHKRKAFNCFFSYLYDGMINCSVIDEISDMGVITFNFSCNNTHQFNLVKKLSPYYNVNLHSEKYAGHKFKSIGANPLWWPMASNPNYYSPTKLNKEIDVSFVGANYPPRAKYMKYLFNNNVDIQLFGSGWNYYQSSSRFRSNIKKYIKKFNSVFSLSSNRRLTEKAELEYVMITNELNKQSPHSIHSILSDHELISLYSRSKISLGILDVYENHDPSLSLQKHLHLREFEAPMCGALYCTGFSDEISEMFEPGKEILTYSSYQEMVELIEYYLLHEAEANQIREAGYQRALNDHTYHIRFKQLFESIGLT